MRCGVASSDQRDIVQRIYTLSGGGYAGRCGYKAASERLTVLGTIGLREGSIVGACS